MVYKKSYRKSYYRKPYYKKRSAWDDTKSCGNLALKAYTMSKYLARQVNSELKQFTVTNTGVEMTSSGAVVDLFGLTQGDDQNDRVGNSVKPARATIRLKLDIGAQDHGIARVESEK